MKSDPHTKTGPTFTCKPCSTSEYHCVKTPISKFPSEENPNNQTCFLPRMWNHLSHVTSKSVLTHHYWDRWLWQRYQNMSQSARRAKSVSPPVFLPVSLSAGRNHERLPCCPLEPLDINRQSEGPITFVGHYWVTCCDGVLFLRQETTRLSDWVP